MPSPRTRSRRRFTSKRSRRRRKRPAGSQRAYSRVKLQRRNSGGRSAGEIRSFLSLSIAAEICVTFRLTVDLTDAERYRDAYHKLLDEVGVLAARNQLAESEANRLSQFNAEILGHNNPAQRIVYLDRVRRELAETKQVRLRSETRPRTLIFFFFFF